MPRKVRDLLRDLARAGFVSRGGMGGGRITISGAPGDDALPFQALAEVRNEEE
jgi:hypothetical protein